MLNKFFQPVRMEQQYVPTKSIAVMYQVTGVNAPVSDGTLAILGDFYNEPVYTSAYGSNMIDLNTRVAVLPTSTTVAGVGVLNVINVPTATGVDNNIYNIGVETIGLTAPAGMAVAFRKLSLDDNFMIGSDNTTSALTVGQYAIVDTSGNWAPSATIPGTGLVAKVMKSNLLSRGTSADITEYFLLIKQLQ